jgi:hypothetical protein
MPGCLKKLRLNTVKIKGSTDVNETDLSYTEECCFHPPSSSHFVKRKQSHTKNKIKFLSFRELYIYMVFVLCFTCNNIRSYFRPTQPTFTSHVFRAIGVELTESCV